MLPRKEPPPPAAPDGVGLKAFALGEGRCCPGERAAEALGLVRDTFEKSWPPPYASVLIERDREGVDGADIAPTPSSRHFRLLRLPDLPQPPPAFTSFR